MPFRSTILRRVVPAALILASAATSAFAQDASGWQEYSYPELGFAVRAPRDLRELGFRNGYFELTGSVPMHDHIRLYVMDAAQRNNRSENKTLDDHSQNLVNNPMMRKAYLEL